MRATNTTIEFYADPISPYVYIAWHRLRTLLTGRPEITVQVRPVLLAGLLGHFGQLGPAEIPTKRDWTYRQVQWLAHSNGLRLDLPAGVDIEIKL